MCARGSYDAAFKTVTVEHAFTKLQEVLQSKQFTQFRGAEAKQRPGDLLQLYTDAAKVRQHLDAGEIVLITALGYSASGAVFNVKTEEVASKVAS